MGKSRVEWNWKEEMKIEERGRLQFSGRGVIMEKTENGGFSINENQELIPEVLSLEDAGSVLEALGHISELTHGHLPTDAVQVYRPHFRAHTSAGGEGCEWVV